MKKIVNVILIFLVINNCALAQDENCVRKATFGETEICLPKIEGYQESYTDPIIKQFADGTEVPTNMILGFYLNNQTYERRDSLGLISFDDFFKIYGTKQIKNLKADSSLLKKLQDLLTENFPGELIKKEFDKIGLEIKIGAPTIIKTYNLNANSFTCIMLTKYELEGMKSHVTAMTINGLLLNEKLIWMAYLLNYNGEETILRLQENSNAILTKLLSINGYYD